MALPLDAVDLFSLCEALGDGSGTTEWYFHVDTGDVRPAGGDWDDGFDEDDLDEQGWVLVERSGSREAFEDMELFANAVGDVRGRDLLLRALAGKGVFRRFRDTLRELPDLKEPWLAWSNAREEARAIRWLMAGDHVHELEADAALGDRRASAARALDAVRAGGGPSFDLGEAPGRWAEIVAALDRGTTVTLTREGRAFAAIATYDTQV